MRQMHFSIAMDQICHTRSFAQGAPGSQRITTGIDIPAQLLGPFACSTHTPFRPARECHPALAPGIAVVDRESPTATAIDAGGKAAHIGVENLVIPPIGGLGISQDLLGQLLSVHHP